MTNKLGRSLVPIFVIGALVVSLFSAAPAMADNHGPVAEDQIPEGWLDDFVFEPGSLYYILAEGDTLQDVAERTGLTVEELAAVNEHLEEDVLYVGQPVLVPEISIPATGEPAAVEPSEAAAPAFGPDFRITPEDYANRIFMFDAPRGSIVDGYYIATESDNLSNLAQRMGVTLVALLDANGHMHNPNVIFRGEAIRIPGGVAQSFLDDPLAPAVGVDVGPVPLDRVPFTEQ
jgi:LysM repeat protein